MEHSVLGGQAKELDFSNHPGELRKSPDFPWDAMEKGKDNSVGARMDLDTYPYGYRGKLSSWCG